MASDSPPLPQPVDAMPSLQVLPAHDYRRERWRNGLGWTREILRHPDREDWDWRLSIAEIQADAPFSAFPGVERMLVLLHGEGLRLEFDGADAGAAQAQPEMVEVETGERAVIESAAFESEAVESAAVESAAVEREAVESEKVESETVEIAPPHGRYRFAGERVVHARPLGDPVHVFNLMWRRDRVHAELWHRPLVGSMVLFVEPGETWLVFLIGGRARLGDGAGQGVHLAAQDIALAAAPGGQRRRYLLDGGGEALLIRVRPEPA